MSWIFIAAFAYFLNAITAVADKFLVSKKIPQPAVYSFYMGILSVFAALLIPFFDFFIPEARVLFLALFAGIIFLFALFYYFKALSENEVSRSATIVGGFMPIFTICLGYWLLGERFNLWQIFAFILLVFGGVLASFDSAPFNLSAFRSYLANSLKPRCETGPDFKGLKLLILASFFFAFSSVLIKIVYAEQPFLNGFVWSRFGSFLAAFLFLIPTESRREIFKNNGKIAGKTGLLVIGNKILAGIMFVILNFAIALGSVSFVNAMRGLQYVFIFIIMVFLSRKFPDVLKEEIGRGAVIQKISAVVLIGAGLAILTLVDY